MLIVRSFLGTLWIMPSSCVRHYARRGSYLPAEIEPGRYPFPKRQVPKCGLLSFKDRISELEDKTLSMKSLDPVDIGLAFKRTRLLPNQLQPKNLAHESDARKHRLQVPIHEIHSAGQDTEAPMRKMRIATHFGVFESLFGDPHFFVPKINIGIYFGGKSDNQSVQEIQPVYTGNFISPTLAQEQPIVDLSEAPSDSLWTLIMSCPDEPIGGDTDLPPANEYVHWILVNLESRIYDSSCLDDGSNQVLSYLPPLPYYGSGFHRHVFTLYRQDDGKKLDPNQLRSVLPEDTSANLRYRRSFSTHDFYRSLQSDITPAGLAFCQCTWDESVRSYFRNNLDEPEPLFELRFPPPLLPPQEQFPVANSWTKARRHPHGLPLVRERFGVHNDVSFDVYLDRYRDSKDVWEEIVRQRLAREGNPLEPTRQKLPYPAAVEMPQGAPSWWRTRELQRRLRLGRWRHLEGSS